MYDVVILGAGPSGLTAATYTARARLRTLVVTGPMVGGQISRTYQVDNYPGFPEGLTGLELSERFRKQAERFGAEFLEADATGIDFSGRPLKVKVKDTRIEARSVVIATGSISRKLKVPGEDRLLGHGVFVCATCDAALFEDQRVVVVGGGDSAIQEALDLAKFASEVTIVHRRGELRACACLKARAEENPKIRFSLNTVVEEIIGGQRVEAVRLRNLVSGEVTVKETEGVLVAIGWEPNTSILRGQLSLDEWGFVVADGVKTSVEGVYVAGDLVDRVYRQVVTSCGSGCMAAIEAERYLAGGRGAE